MAEASPSQNEKISKDEGKNDGEENLDTPDGFIKHLKKVFYNLCGVVSQEKDLTENKPEVDSGMAPYNWDEDTYNFKQPKRGLAVIINNEDFSRSKEFGNRPGSSHDASALYHSFNRLGFDVMLYPDLPAWKMMEVLKAAASKYDHSQADCFVCTILTHGDQTWSNREWDRMGTTVRLDLLFGTDGKVLTTKSVVEMFNDQFCPQLKGKPRLFFIQACRGVKYDDGQTVLVKRPKSGSGVVPRGGRGDARDGEHSRDMTDMLQEQTATSPQNTQRQESLSSSVDPPGFYQDATEERGGGDERTEVKAEGVRGSDKKDGKGEGEEDSEQDEEEAGRGDKTDAKWHRVKDIPVSPAPLYRDCLIMYATPPGHFAWRRNTGSWFIQALCELLDSNTLDNTSLLRGLNYVSGRVAREKQSENSGNPATDNKKEMPVVESMLTKDIFLARKSRR